MKEQYAKTLTEVTNTKNAEGLSGIDKMEMNLTKSDEGAIFMSELNAEDAIRRVDEMWDIPVTNEEIEYYILHHKPQNLQIELVRSYYANIFGQFRDTLNLDRHQYTKLLLKLKKKLLMDGGYDPETGDPVECALPYILTGNLQDKLNTRIIRNSKYTTKCEDNFDFQVLNEEKYQYLNELYPDYIMQLASTLVNTVFTYVVYEDQDLLGKPLEYNEDLVTRELTDFLKCI